MTAPIARVFGGPGQINRVLTTRPGHSVSLRGGVGSVYHWEDMPHLLRRPELTIELMPEQTDWLPRWAERCGEFHPARATVTAPDREVGPPPFYTIPEPEETEVSSTVRRRQGKVGAHAATVPPPDSSVDDAVDDALAKVPSSGWVPHVEDRSPAGT